MKIRTAEEFIDFMDRETSWRKRELAVLNSEINKTHYSTYTSEALLRSAVMLLYAHWEGYIKNSSIAYLDHVLIQKFEYKKLALHFRAIGIKHDLNEMYNTNISKMGKLMDILEFLLNKQEEKCRFTPEKIIDTKSNLNSKVFKEIVITLGLDYKNYETKENLIDQKLLNYRNNIAHGKELVVNGNDYQELFKEVIVLIDTFKNDLENSAILKSYLLKNHAA